VDKFNTKLEASTNCRKISNWRAFL